ncbi:MAG TPA: TonB-dependent receptor, partial [Terriglobia bacterium]|nr:TonB-dependent receptor [Terriglobia bacterium]
TLEREWSASDHTRFYADHQNTRFMVPNEILQQAAGQREDRDGRETMGQISHTHIFSTHVLGQFRGMIRQTDARLWSNTFSTPIQPSQDRGFHEGYVGGSVSLHYGVHELKAGGEGWVSSVRENLGFHIAAYKIGSVRVFDSDVPRDFSFSARSPSRTQSAFIQDAWHVDHLNVNAGIRFDHYRLVADETAWSPRLGVSYEMPRSGLVFRGSYDRAFQIPAIENILLASSDLGQTLGGGAFLSLKPSRGNFVEAGFSKTMTQRVRLDGNWYRRSFRNFADDSLLLNTGVSFPIAFSQATIHGFETKLELRRAGPFSGYVSYSNMLGIGRLPVAGGLFLGDNADQLNGTGSFPISQDQRNTVRSQLRYQPHPRFWFAAGASYNSGLPFEIDGPANPAFVAQQYGADILGRVNFDRGRVRPSSSVDASAGVELVHTDKAKLRFQTDAFNLTNRLNVINFAGVFSGTAVDAPRSYGVRLRAEF